MKKQKLYLYFGIGIFLALTFSYFIKIPLNSGSNYVTTTSILGLLMFYNPFILGAYIVIATILIYNGIKKHDSQKCD
ncbi:hypothetical protein COU60_02430 [Candidatus Pacearchaeota archaeon CG10_big_fil_rev_8_21_14_0_10_34_76]|nr:MAG: hypothetical protein COU60_02430 [Candidatus Pacearchaeota archaeon CG10_big_fil_rev_8_21_14_0_10_34_76]